MAKRHWTIGFDADDTLWHNEQGFVLTQTRFAELLADFTPKDHLRQRLIAAEMRNLRIYGFGVKGFTLSMIETAIEVTDGKLPTAVIAELLDLGRRMLQDEVEVFKDVGAVLKTLKDKAHIVLITKGDLLDQERKLAQSGLGDLFDRVEIVSDKTTDTYARIFARHDTAHQMMVGNSLRSDVIPALNAGLWAVHVPHDLTWAYEHDDPPVTHRHFRQITALSELPALIESID